ncbi:hypothetical protein [Sphaerisporangium fuscum]|uniref:hypothetical protein n=1 Tax=Sphaerisporangium fuscum TaxID=2835868 RepID=UPI001BDD6690|nr:hypothetical protein [Sphaerisporangium fuscum]
MTNIDFGLLGIDPLPDTSGVDGHADALGKASQYHGQLQGDGVAAFRPAGDDQGESADATRTYLAGQGGVLPEAGHLSHHAAIASGGVSAAGKTIAWTAGSLTAVSLVAAVAVRVGVMNPEALAVLARARAVAAQMSKNMRVITQKVGRVLKLTADEVKPQGVNLTKADPYGISRSTSPAINFRLDRAHTILSRTARRLDIRERRIGTINDSLAEARYNEQMRIELKGGLDGHDYGDYTNGVYRYQPQLNPYLTREEQALLDRHARTVYNEMPPIGDAVSASTEEARMHLAAVRNLAKDHPDFDLAEVSRAHQWARDLEERAKQVDRDLAYLKHDFAPKMTVHLNPEGGWADVQPHYFPSGRVWTGPNTPPAYRDVPPVGDIPGMGMPKR